MLLDGNFVELSVVLQLGKCPPFFTILSSKCILASGHPVFWIFEVVRSDVLVLFVNSKETEMFQMVPSPLKLL